MNIPSDQYEKIEKEITGKTRPAGIDAKKTHTLILKKLQEIEEKLDRIEEVILRNSQNR